MDQGQYHDRDAWTHTVDVVGGVSPEDFILRMAAWFHDVGKAKTRTVEADGRVRFFDHPPHF